MSVEGIINYFYAADDELKQLLLVHSRAVAQKALRICDQHPELGMDREFVEAAAMLHDIGIRECHAPSIHCEGTRPYIQHGLAGAEMMEALQGRKAEELGLGQDMLTRLSRVCQRHTGAGITRAEVVAQGLPLPLPDDESEPYMPETLEEKVVCYADKFFSKTRPTEEKTIGQAEHSLAKFGEDGLTRFRQWEEIFEM